MSESSLRITEVFLSLQGEALSSGLPTVFVRLTGCPLRCQYCDTAYAFHGGEKRLMSELLDEIASHKVKRVCVTGGEPLAQPGVHELMTTLCDQDYEVSLETSGALPVDDVDERVQRVIDWKTPDSAEQDKNLASNMQQLRASDQIKFVICSRKDYDWARFETDRLELADKVAAVWFSPSFGQQDATQLADWIVEDRLPVRFQLQLHKLLWNDEPGR